MTLRTHTTCLRFAALALFGGCLPSCLNREETITIHAAGAVSVAHRWSGDGADLDGGSVRLPDPGVYRVERRTEINDNGDEEDVLTAAAEFESVDRMPTRFGKTDDALAASALVFETELEIRHEGNKTHYVFKRRYAPRDWADYQYYWGKAFPKEVEDLMYDDKRWRQSFEDRCRVVDAIADYWRMQMQHWAERTLAQAAPKHPRLLEAQLEVRAAIAGRISAALGSEAAMRVIARPVEEIDEWSGQLMRELEQLIADKGRELLGLDEPAVAAMFAAMALQRDDFEVSRDLEDESFVVRVKLPGTVTGHNGDAN